MRTREVILSLMLLVVITAVPVSAQDVQRGQGKSGDCVACHGANGFSPNPMFPHLAGQNATYLQLQLEKFKSGDRYHPLMTPVAQSLTQQEINDLAEYYSSINPVADASQ